MSVENVFGPGFSGLGEREKLERTARELEAVVVTQLLSAMRRTVPEGGLFGKSLADDVFRSMLDAEIARGTAGKSPFGLADAVVQSLENRVKVPDGHSESRDGEFPFRRIG